MAKNKSEQGIALVAGMMLTAMLVAVLTAYFTMTQVELRTTKASINQSQGFYAAEAGLNVRAELIRQTFLGYNRPQGTPPAASPGTLPCSGVDTGSDDFACVSYDLRERDVQTHVEESAGNPTAILIPPGEPYQNLNAQEYGYEIRSIAVNAARPEAILGMRVNSRLVPLFQFAAFYDKDLEILPGPNMTLAGPVHSNGDLYLGANNTLTIEGQVTTAQGLFHGRKNDDVCMPGGVAVYDPSNPASVPGCGPGRIEVTDPDVTPWNGMIRLGVDAVTVPPPEVLDPVPGQIYWDKADIRLMLELDTDGNPVGVEVRNPDGTVDATMTTFLVDDDCNAGLNAADSSSGALYNHREGTGIEMLEVDVTRLLDCMQLNSSLIGGKALDDSTEGGLVWYLGVDGPDADVVNNYGVRVKNGAKLASTIVGAPEIRGLTVVSGQALYVEGDYNSDAAWKPAAFLGDSLNVLSNAWNDAVSSDPDKNNRLASDTAIYAAFLAGTDTTGGPSGEGTGGQDSGNYNGGLENYPRFHEKWSGETLTYRGSFVSLNQPRHVDGTWGDQSYSPPARDWGYETRFNDAANLPPLSPRFVYLRQELFSREYGL